MRIWHQKLIPCLCQKHLCAMWREGLGMYKIITENKKGYRNHPATQEFIESPFDLYIRLIAVRSEMLERGYHPKEIEWNEKIAKVGFIKPWQTLEEQIERIKEKNCQCNLSKL